MRKTSTYARKRAMRIKTNEHLYMDRARQLCSMDGVVAHSTPFSRNPIFNPDTIMLPVRIALQSMIDRSLQPDDKHAFDTLACAVGESKIRYMEIGGEDTPAVALLTKADDALARAYDRWKRTGQWGLDGPAIVELKDAVSLFEEVLLASSPNQMIEAERTHKRWLELMRQGKLKTPTPQAA